MADCQVDANNCSALKVTVIKLINGFDMFEVYNINK